MSADVELATALHTCAHAQIRRSMLLAPFNLASLLQTELSCRRVRDNASMVSKVKFDVQRASSANLCHRCPSKHDGDAHSQGTML